jgi:hypothetical protein
METQILSGAGRWLHLPFDHIIPSGDITNNKKTTSTKFCNPYLCSFHIIFCWLIMRAANKIGNQIKPGIMPYLPIMQIKLKMNIDRQHKHKLKTFLNENERSQ